MFEMQSVWGWQPALYLFLGGMGAGAFVTAALLFLRKGGDARRTISASAWASVFCLVAGLLCLLTELTNPLRGMMLWQSFSNFGSWMTLGAWILVGALVVFGIFAVLSTKAIGSRLFPGVDERLWNGSIMRALAVAGMVLGLGVAAYTGILLMSAPGVPLWNTFLLPCLFTISGLDTGVALVEVLALVNGRSQPISHSQWKLLERLVVCLVLLEAVVLVAFLGTMGAGVHQETGVLSAEAVTSGALAPWFWGMVVVCGLIFPLVAAIIALVPHKRQESGTIACSTAHEEALASERSSQNHAVTLVGAMGALVGGCALRFIVVLAGIHADPVGETMGQIFTELLSRL